MGLDTSYDCIKSSSPYTVNGKHMRMQWCKHAYFITHFNFKSKDNPSMDLSILMYIPSETIWHIIKIILAGLIKIFGYPESLIVPCVTI